MHQNLLVQHCQFLPDILLLIKQVIKLLTSLTLISVSGDQSQSFAHVVKAHNTLYYLSLPPDA